VADIRKLPLADGAVEDSVAAFVLNHLTEPEAGLAELARVTRSNGAILACVYSTTSRSEVRDLIDATATEHGWKVPAWYAEPKTHAAPLLGTAEAMRVVAQAAGLAVISVDETPVDVGPVPTSVS
jgi:ubiquinone/menaquinone biosynthesis C-methylase UbiE